MALVQYRRCADNCKNDKLNIQHMCKGNVGFFCQLHLQPRSHPIKKHKVDASSMRLLACIGREVQLVFAICLKDFLWSPLCKVKLNGISYWGCHRSCVYWYTVFMASPWAGGVWPEENRMDDNFLCRTLVLIKRLFLICLSAFGLCHSRKLPSIHYWFLGCHVLWEGDKPIKFSFCLQHVWHNFISAKPSFCLTVFKNPWESLPVNFHF